MGVLFLFRKLLPVILSYFVYVLFHVNVYFLLFLNIFFVFLHYVIDIFCKSEYNVFR